MKFEVFVQGINNPAYSGDDPSEAAMVYTSCMRKSAFSHGSKYSGKQITLMSDGHALKQFQPLRINNAA